MVEPVLPLFGKRKVKLKEAFSVSLLEVYHESLARTLFFLVSLVEIFYLKSLVNGHTHERPCDYPIFFH